MLRKIHKWTGLILVLIIVIFALSGIVLNHRETFSGIDVNRKFMPAEYRYSNWNNAAVISSLKLSPDSILLYGNAGIWLTDSLFSDFTDFNSGFALGVDNRKIFDVVLTADRKLVAATLFGLYNYNFQNKKWNRVQCPVKEVKIVDLIVKRDSLFVLTRSQLLVTTDLLHFGVIKVLPAEGDDNKISLFRTLWVIHSGEIYGLTGKLLVDSVALIFIILSVTGLIYWLKKLKIKSKKQSREQLVRTRRVMQFNLKWHNKLGWITLLFLTLTTITGMFLRPPLLIAIAEARVGKLPYTELADTNTWFDKFRKMEYDSESNRYLLATSEGLFSIDADFSTKPIAYTFQPPVSVMGITVLRKISAHEWLIGSFEGLYTWNPLTGMVYDYTKKQPYQPQTGRGAPIGEHLVSGYVNEQGCGEVFFDYNQGAVKMAGEPAFAKMPEKISSTPISLWNVALEFHTTRIYSFLIGDFYILIIPLAGLGILLMLISGFIVWNRHHRAKAGGYRKPELGIKAERKTKDLLPTEKQ